MLFTNVTFCSILCFMPRSNEWGESLDQTITRSRVQKGLLAYSLCEGEVIQAAISGKTPDAIKLEEDRTITARALGTRVGALEIIEDTATEDSWKNRTICLGSYAFSTAGIGFHTPGLLRGMINQNAGVVVDFSVEHFVGNQPPSYLLAEYETLHLEGVLIF